MSTEIADAVVADSLEPDATAITTELTQPENNAQAADTKRRALGSATITVTQLLVAALIVVLVAIAAVSTWLAVSAHSDLNEANAAAANDQRAEQIALDYAVGAAQMDYKDTAGWRTRLTANTLPGVAQKLTTAAGSIEQIIVPLQWNSTATPLAAKVRDVTNGVLTVDTFVNVETKNMQAPDGMTSTATYVVTIDPDKDWKISDVGGIGAIAPK